MKHGDGHVHCGDVELEPTPRVLVVRDSTGKFMGELYDAVEGSNIAYLVYRGDSATYAYFVKNPVVVLKVDSPINPTDPSGFHLAAGIYFSGADCLGTAYIRGNSNTGLTVGVGIPQLSVEEIVGGQILYVPLDPDLPFDTETVRSSLNGFEPPQTCSSGSPFSIDEVTEAVQVPLSFQPPYKIGY